MLFDLNSTFTQAVKKVESGKLRVAGVHDYGDRVVIVLQSGTDEKKNKVHVLDYSPNPGQEEPPGVSLIERRTAEEESEDTDITGILEEAGVRGEEPKNVDKRGRVVREDGRVMCRHCGKPCTSRGATRHENTCNLNPKHQRIGPLSRKKRREERDDRGNEA